MALALILSLWAPDVVSEVSAWLLQTKIKQKENPTLYSAGIGFSAFCWSISSFGTFFLRFPAAERGQQFFPMEKENLNVSLRSWPPSSDGPEEGWLGK